MGRAEETHSTLQTEELLPKNQSVDMDRPGAAAPAA